MKRPKDITQDELEALPEFFYYDEIPLPDSRYPDAKGSYVRQYKAKKGYVTTFNRGDLISFVDKEGVIWGFTLCDDGWNKVFMACLSEYESQTLP